MTEDAEIEAAFTSFMEEKKIDREEALLVILRDWLIGHGYLPLSEEDSAQGGVDPLGI